MSTVQNPFMLGASMGPNPFENKPQDPKYQQFMRDVNGADLYHRIYTADDSYVENGITWDPIPGSWFNEYQLRGDTLNSMQFNRNWTFSQTDQGAFAFEVKGMGSGLVINLAHPISDQLGYYIVIDDDQHKTGVYRKYGIGKNVPTRQRHFGSFVPLPRAQVDSSFRLKASRRQAFWVVYEYGKIMVGVGPNPGEGNKILVAEDAHPSPGIQDFGFGRVGNRSPTTAWVRNVRSFKKRIHRSQMRPYNRTLGAPQYLRCFDAHLYPR